MATKAELLALAERCEKANGPDRKLDAAIHSALGDPMHYDPGGIALPTYSASLDAALTLVPSEPDKHGNVCRIILERLPTADAYWIAEVRYHAQDGGNAFGPTGPGVLCAAALRAIVSKDSPNGT